MHEYYKGRDVGGRGDEGTRVYCTDDVCSVCVGRVYISFLLPRSHTPHSRVRIILYYVRIIIIFYIKGAAARAFSPKVRFREVVAAAADRSVNSRQRRWRRLVGGVGAGRGCNNPRNAPQ